MLQHVSVDPNHGFICDYHVGREGPPYFVGGGGGGGGVCHATKNVCDYIKFNTSSTQPLSS